MTASDESSLKEHCEQMNKRTLLDALRASGACRAAVSYEGGGDSGYADNVSAQDAGNAEIALTSMTKYFVVQCTRKDSLWHWQVVEQERTLAETMADFAMQLVCRLHAGWENNEGGFGKVVFDIDAGLVRIEHSTYVVETEYEETQL
jgi:hypothetical protein